MKYNYRPPYENELWHYGVMGMKWGVRRYQNPDGTYTDAGKKHYSKVERLENKRQNAIHKMEQYNEAVRKVQSARNKWNDQKEKALFDSSVKQTAEYKDAKKDNARLTNRRALKQLELERNQAKWELDRADQKIADSKGEYSGKRVSPISPKAKNVGKRVAMGLLSGTLAAVSVAALPLGVGAAAGAAQYGGANIFGKMVLGGSYKAAMESGAIAAADLLELSIPAGIISGGVVGTSTTFKK